MNQSDQVLLIRNQDTYYRQFTRRFNYVNQINLVAGQNKYYLDNGAGNNVFLMDKAIFGLSIRFNSAAECRSAQDYVLCKLDVLQNAFLTLMVNSVQTIQADPMDRYGIHNDIAGQLPYVQLSLPKGLNLQTSFILLNNTGVGNIVANSCIEMNWEYGDYQASASDPV